MATIPIALRTGQRLVIALEDERVVISIAEGDSELRPVIIQAVPRGAALSFPNEGSTWSTRILGPAIVV